MRRRQPNSKDRLRKAQLSFYAQPEDYEALKSLSARTGVPQQVYLRRGLAHVPEINDYNSVEAAASTARGRARDAIQKHKEVKQRWRSEMHPSK